jgi:hypothetical protein
MSKKTSWTQEEIKFYNMHTNHIGGWYSECPFKSAGNLIHWIYVYAGLPVADSITVGQDGIDYLGQKLVLYEFNEDIQMPEFGDNFFSFKEIISQTRSRIFENQRLYLRHLDILKFHDDSFSREMNQKPPYNWLELLTDLNKDFEESGKKGNWRNYLTSHIVDIWGNMALEQKLAAYIRAYKQFQRYEKIS